MSVKKGMAGLILLIIVIGYMMTISSSSSLLIQSESTGKSARRGYKNAYYAAVAGLGVVTSRLRMEQNLTFSATETDRPYFTRVAADPDNHYQEWTGSNTTYSGFTRLIAPGWINNSSNFVINNIDNEETVFLICSYPGPDPVTSDPVYFVKCQGKYKETDTGKEYVAQIWAKVVINAPSRIFSIQSFGPMAVQSTDIITGTEVNDFWDWQNRF
ncbi:MAG: hypothetical protein Kow0029_26800 [Candidatus Rifleibacteriota bacterium]